MTDYNPVLSGALKAHSLFKLLHDARLQDEELVRRKSKDARDAELQAREAEQQDLHTRFTLNQAGARKPSMAEQTEMDLGQRFQAGLGSMSATEGEDGMPVRSAGMPTGSFVPSTLKERQVKYKGDSFILPDRDEEAARTLKNKRAENMIELVGPNGERVTMDKRQIPLENTVLRQTGAGQRQEQRLGVQVSEGQKNRDARADINENTLTSQEVRAGNAISSREGEGDKNRAVTTGEGAANRTSRESEGEKNRAAKAVEDEQKRNKLQQAAEDKANAQHDAWQKEEQNLHRQRTEIGSALTAKDGEQFTDPVTGKERKMDWAWRARLQAQLETAGTQITALQKQQKGSRQKRGVGEFAAPAAAPAAGKVLPSATIDAYVKATPGMTKAKALAEAKAMGLEVQ